MSIRLTEKQRIAAAELARRRHVRSQDTGLLDFIQKTTPQFRRPDHLTPFVDLLEQSRHRPIDAVIALPPRHGKTETILHFIAWILSLDPSRALAYVSYADEIAKAKARRARGLAERAGVLFGDKSTEGRWETAAGGFVKATGILGQLTAEGFHYVIVDDPIKGREMAESPALRRKIRDTFDSDVYSRRDPEGTSIFVVHTPWHTEDLGRSLVTDGWPEVSLPVFDQEGDVLWPEMWPADTMRQIEKRVGVYTWESLYMCRPRPRGGAIFGAPSYCDEIPRDLQHMSSIGIDLAYSAKTHADYSVSIVLSVDTKSPNRTIYVRDVVRKQCSTTEFKKVIEAHRSSYPGAGTRWYTSTTEKGTAEFLGITPVLATADKHTRAQGVAAAWNSGRILVPLRAHWAKDFIDEVCSFTGLGDRHDDQVDSLAAAFDALERNARYWVGVKNAAADVRLARSG